MNMGRRTKRTFWVLFALSVLLISTAAGTALADDGGVAEGSEVSPYAPEVRPPLILPRPIFPDGEAESSQAGRAFSRQALGDAPIVDPLLDMKALVILDTTTYTITNTDGTTYTVDFGGVNAMVRHYLDAVGIPYDVVDVSTRPISTTPVISESLLWDGVNHGAYYAIFVATSTSWRPDSELDQYAGLNEAERQLINGYQRAFGVRKVTFYAYPNVIDYGLEYVDVATLPTTATLTSEGQSVFEYLRPDVEITLNFTGTYGYAAVPTGTTTSLMAIPAVGGGEHTIMSVFDDPNAGEHLALTMSAFYPSMPPLGLFTRLLPYGMINWATRGLFLGERHLYFVGQPDDVFSAGDRWDIDERRVIYDDAYRNEPEDIENLLSWMSWLRANVSNAGDFKIEMPFNAEGTALDREGKVLSGEIVSPSLTATLLEHEDEFVWLNHTFSHLNLDNATAATATLEIGENIIAAAELGLTDFTSTTLLTGEYSGVTNTDVVTAAYDLGVRYMLVNESIDGYENPTPNTGIPYPGQPSLLQVPRYANNIFYFATTPEEETDYYNTLYSTDYPTTTATFKYTDTVEAIVNQAFGFLLDFSINPTMFHMNNLEAYEYTTSTLPTGSHGGSRTLMGDFIESLYGKYNRYYNDDVPILSLRTQEIGQRMWERQAYNTSGVVGTIACGQGITLSTVNAARIPVTGISDVAPYSGVTETYAGQPIAYFDMGDGQTIFIESDPSAIPAAPSSLFVAPNETGQVLQWTATELDTAGDPIEIAFYRIYRSGTLIGQTAATTYEDASGASASAYGVTAVADDCARTESSAATASTTAVRLVDFSTNRGSPAGLVSLAAGLLVIVGAGVGYLRKRSRR